MNSRRNPLEQSVNESTCLCVARATSSPRSSPIKYSIQFGLIVAGSCLAPLHLALGDLPAKAPSVDERYLLSEQQLCTRVLKSNFLARTELLFGLSRSGGPGLTELEFKHFIDTKVTPRFPEGLTVLSGDGQFKDASGTIVAENSKLLILLYPFSVQTSLLVEDIRRDYKERFQQESVLRIDDLSCVSF